jgi:hypothetical protein
MRIRPVTVHFKDGIHLLGNVRQTVSTKGTGGAFHADDMEATPVGVLIRKGEATSLVPWGSIASCPEVVVEDEKAAKGKA